MPDGVRILLRRNPTPGAIPAPESLQVGEIALNTGDGNLFAKLADSSVRVIGGGGGGAIDESDLVHRSGAETIAGLKTFTDTMTLSSTILAMPHGFAIGNGTLGSGSLAVAIGFNATANGSSAIAIGNLVAAAGSSGLAIGSSAVASGSPSMALGWNTNATKNDSVAVGLLASATATTSLAIGYEAVAAHSDSTAIGRGATTTAASQIMLGTAAQHVMFPGNPVLSMSTSTAHREVARLVQTWVEITDATRKGRLALSVRDWAGAREGLRIEADGTQALTAINGVVTANTALTVHKRLLVKGPRYDNAFGGMVLATDDGVGFASGSGSMLIHPATDQAPGEFKSCNDNGLVLESNNANYTTQFGSIRMSAARVAVHAGTREAIRVESDGTAARIGFHGVNAVPRAPAPTTLEEVIILLRALGLCQ